MWPTPPKTGRYWIYIAGGARTGEQNDLLKDVRDHSTHSPLAAAACCAACSATVYSPKRWPTRPCVPHDMQTRELNARGAGFVRCVRGVRGVRGVLGVLGVRGVWCAAGACAAGRMCSWAHVPHRMLHVLLGARVHTLLLRGGERFAAEGDYALAKAPLHQPVEHAERVLHLHLLELLQHRCEEAGIAAVKVAGRYAAAGERGAPCFSASEPWSKAPAMAFMLPASTDVRVQARRAECSGRRCAAFLLACWPGDHRTASVFALSR